MTTRIAWASLLVVAAVCVEVWCGRLGLLIAAWPLLTLYLGVALGSRWGAWAGLVACVLCEILLVRSWTSLPLAAGVIPLTLFWRRHGDRRYLVIQMLPAGLVGVGYALFAVLAENWLGNRPAVELSQRALLVGAGMAATALAGPLLWRLADLFAILAGLPRFYQPHGLAELAAEEGAA